VPKSAPKGPRQISPGHRPGGETSPPRPPQALKGRYTGSQGAMAVVSPFQGSVSGPRAAPWAGLFGPFRARRDDIRSRPVIVTFPIAWSYLVRGPGRIRARKRGRSWPANRDAVSSRPGKDQKDDLSESGKKLYRELVRILKDQSRRARKV
jgi:hypothetical protein